MIDQNNDPVCGNCLAWREVNTSGPIKIGDARRGICVCLPPTPFAVLDARGNIRAQVDLRPCPAANDTCLHFILRPAAGLAKVPDSTN